MARPVNYTIELNHLKFYVKHGVYSFEKEIRQCFMVDLKLNVELPIEQKIELQNTVDYTEVYNLVKQIIETQEDLLENLVLKILHAILRQYYSVSSCTCRIEKFPQLGGQGSVAICLSLDQEKFIK